MIGKSFEVFMARCVDFIKITAMLEGRPLKYWYPIFPQSDAVATTYLAVHFCVIAV